MKIFISWSGSRSHKVAELLSEWIECVIQAVEPWISSRDIDGGSLWFSEINNTLANVSLGIVCLTKENKDNPWILFEAGALAKGISSNYVCTFLIDLEPKDIQDPLAQFNHTFPERESMKKLLNTINSRLLEKQLKSNILSNVFDIYWDSFKMKFEEINKTTLESPIKETRKEKEILSDVLEAVRTLEKQVRYIKEDLDTKKGFNIVSSVKNASIDRPLVINDDIRPSIHARIRELKVQGINGSTIKQVLNNEGYSDVSISNAFNRIRLTLE